MSGSHLTEREVLQLREAQLRGILETASEAIVTIDESQTIVMANARAAEVFGRAVDQLIGSPLSTLMPPRFRAPHRRAVAAFGAAETPARRMLGRNGLLGLRADGEEFPLEAGISQAHVDGTRLYTVILRDLSEPRRAADALRTSEQLLSATFGVSSVGMAQLDPLTHRFLAVNAAFCALCGYPAPELLTMAIDRLDHPGDPPSIEQIDAWLVGHPNWETERRVLRRDGSTVWVQLSVGTARDLAGRPARLVCVAQDITPRREALTALRAREARLSFLVRLNDCLRQHAAPEAIGYEAACLLGEFAGVDRVGYAEDDGAGGFVAVTRSYARRGKDPEDRVRELADAAAHLGALRAGRTVVQPDIAADPALGDAAKAALAALQVGATVNVPLLQQGQLTAVLFVHSRSARAWTPDEVALFEDVAVRVRADVERARAEAGVRASKAKLEAALASMNDAVFISDAGGHLTDLNDAFASFHRLPDPAACPRTLQAYGDIVEATLPDGTPVPLSQWVIPRALRGESGTNVEFALRDRRSGERWIGSYSFAPIRDAEGHVVGTVCSARDITEPRRVRSELEASQAELRRLIAAQDSVQEQERLRIARELHDDLQQNLAAILMEAEVVRTTATGVDARMREALDRIERLGVEVIGSMRRIVLDLRPQALEELGLVAALQTLADGFIDRHGMDCRVDTAGLGADEQARLAPLATCVYRVVQEALNNVARHAGARQVEVRLSGRPDGRLVVAVVDDGAGIRPEQLHKPESFGLLGMRERVRALGGTLDVRPGPRGGTVVEAVLPFERGAPLHGG